MLLILNTTKTMILEASIPPGLKLTEPCQIESARLLAGRLAGMSRSQLAGLMSLSEKLSHETLVNATLWGRTGRPRVPALFAFRGLLYKTLDVDCLDAALYSEVQKKVRILSGLYGVLRPFDLIEPYRLEMGHKLVMGKTKNLVQFWKKNLTAVINEDLKIGESIISVASQEYMKALDQKKLNGPVILPVFKERRADGSFKTVTVHSKKARGALVRYALLQKAQTPKDLLEFNVQGWKAEQAPPEKGSWLFTRPVTGS